MGATVLTVVGHGGGAAILTVVGRGGGCGCFDDGWVVVLVTKGNTLCLCLIFAYFFEYDDFLWNILFNRIYFGALSFCKYAWFFRIFFLQKGIF